LKPDQRADGHFALEAMECPYARASDGSTPLREQSLPTRMGKLAAMMGSQVSSVRKVLCSATWKRADAITKRSRANDLRSDGARARLSRLLRKQLIGSYEMGSRRDTTACTLSSHPGFRADVTIVGRVATSNEASANAETVKDGIRSRRRRMLHVIACV
jgi:hypothetical protein